MPAESMHCNGSMSPSLQSGNILPQSPSMPYSPTVCHWDGVVVSLWPRGCWQDGVDKSICSQAPPWQLGTLVLENYAWDSQLVLSCNCTFELEFQSVTSIFLLDYSMLKTNCPCQWCDGLQWIIALTWNRCVIKQPQSIMMIIKEL